MKSVLEMRANPPLILSAKTAADLMTPNPTSVRDVATVKEGIHLLVDRGISGAPVIDEAGRPVGVLSRADILVHDREKADYLEQVPEYYHKSDLTVISGETLDWGIQVEQADYARVRDIMTPVVFSVTPDASAGRVVEDMVALKVHRLFVIDGAGVLVGVISALDVLRYLHS